MSLLAVCQCFCRCVGLYPIYYTVYYAPLHRLVFRGRVGIQGTSSYPSDRSSVLSCVGDSLYSRTGVWCGNLLLQNIKLSTFFIFIPYPAISLVTFMPSPIMCLEGCGWGVRGIIPTHIWVANWKESIDIGIGRAQVLNDLSSESANSINTRKGDHFINKCFILTIRKMPHSTS